MRKRQIGYIGLGQMGSAMVGCLGEFICTDPLLFHNLLSSTQTFDAYDLPPDPAEKCSARNSHQRRQAVTSFPNVSPVIC